MAMVVVTVAIVAGLPLWLLSCCALASFLLLVVRFRNCWTPVGQFGLANQVTLFRLVGIVALPWLSVGQVALFGLLLFALDGVDGWIARRKGLAGEFGEFFDKESDAFFMLMLCLLLVRLPQAFGLWILLPGLLRYLFVLFIKLARPPQRKEQRSAKGRWIFFFMMLALLFPFAAYPALADYYHVPALLMTLVLICSFADSLRMMYRVPREPV